MQATPQSKWATGSLERQEFAYMRREGDGVLRYTDDRGPIPFFLTHFISLCLLLLFPLHCSPDSIPFGSVSPFHPALQNSSYDCLIMAKNKRKKKGKERKKA